MIIKFLLEVDIKMKPTSKDKKVLKKIEEILDEMEEQRGYSPKGTREQRGDPSFVGEDYLPPEEDEERKSYGILYSRRH